MMISPDQERELTAETNERRKRTIEQIVLDNECSISPLYGLIGEQGGGLSIPFLWHMITRTAVVMVWKILL